MIYFDSDKKIFYLETIKTTYAFGIYRDVAPVHIYWGERIERNLTLNLVDRLLNRSLMAVDSNDICWEKLPLEFSTYGCSDTRIPTFGAVYTNGSRHTKFTYVDYKIESGKPGINGLPSTYYEVGDKVDTLTIQLRDEVNKIDLLLFYSVFEDLNAIARSVKIINIGETCKINTALSATVDFYGMPNSELLTLDGTWCRERFITRREIVYGNQNIESRVGYSSAYHNPFIAICSKNATENYGNVYGFSLVYSGNFTAGIELDAYNGGRAYIGINPFEFEYVLESGESFQTPEVVLVYSSQGLGEMSRIYHKLYRTRLCRGKYRDSERFILINNWEATYFDFDEEKIVKIAAKAAEIGVDTMVLDDGWFGNRVNDKAGLGDWFENRNRFPKGLKSLAERINSLNMHFGIWFEPEMVNPDSELYRAHPDWIIHNYGDKGSLCRNQYVLDLSRNDVCEYIINAVSNILCKANIEYVKWDLNRYMSEVSSAILPANRQGEVMHRYILGLYNILEILTNKFPNVLFESCASGGGRFDPGMLYYMPQTWTSDDTDAIERLKIQYGTSIVYPYSSMGAHVSSCPNHQVKRITPFTMRCNVATVGQFGFELDLNECTSEELEMARKAIIQHKELWNVFHKGDCFRLRSPFDGDISAIEFISEDKNTVLLCIDSKMNIPNAQNDYIVLEGLEPKSRYILNDKEIYGGDYLMNKGYFHLNIGGQKSLILKFKKID